MKSCLIVRLGSLGDLVHTIPAATALRKAFPDARIDWVTDPRYVDFLGLVPGIDGRIGVDTRSAASTLGTIAGLRQVGYDAVLDLQGLLKSAVLARAAGGKRTIGFTRRHLREPAAALFYTDTVDPMPAVHVIDKNLALLSELGVGRLRPAFTLLTRPVPGIDEAVARVGGGGFVLINPGAAWPNKRWPPARFGAIAERLRSRYGWRSLVLWGPGEEQAAHEVVASSQGAAELSPATAITEIGTLAKVARLMISGDTGPTHIAGAVGTPIVALFGPTRAERNGPWAPEDIAISRVDRCKCIYERRCRLSEPCINDIQVDEVMAAIARRVSARG